MQILNVEQNSPEWHAARLGRFTASNMSRIISPLGKQSTSVDKYVTDLIAEKITGLSAEKFKGNVHTERGKTLEEEAADYYAMLRGVELTKVGFCMTDDGIVGCSPDRYVGTEGMLEIKTCLASIMTEFCEQDDPEKKLEQEHRPQTQCGLHVNSDRKWVDTMLYCPGWPKPLIVRSVRQTSYIMDMVRYTNMAHVSLQTRLAALRLKGFEAVS